MNGYVLGILARIFGTGGTVLTQEANEKVTVSFTEY